MPFLSEEQALKVMMNFNPWWTTGTVLKEMNKPVRRVAFYEIKRVLMHPKVRRIVFLSGARRVGKTTLMYQMIGDLLSQGFPARRILYLSYDHPLLKFFDMGKLVELFMHNVCGNGDDVLYLFFDEIQYARDWDKWLKVLYDGNFRYRIMVTGSAAPVLAARGIESGVGRWVTVKIPTLSFYEYIELIGVPERPSLRRGIKPTRLHYLSKSELSELMFILSGLQKHFHRYLLVGGFPELALSDDTAFAQRVLREDVADKVLKRDLTALFGTRNVNDLEKIFLYLCLHSGGIIVQESLAKEMQVSRQTVAHYLSLLEQSNLIYISNPVEVGGKKVLKRKPKVYVADAALRNAVLLLDESVLSDPNEMGVIVETAVFKHVAAFYYPVLPTIGYFRGKGGNKEVDIVVSLPKGKILLEVKYKEETSLKKNDVLVELADLPDTLGALLITKNADDYGVLPFKTATPVIKIPAFAFLYLLGHAEKESKQGVSSLQ